MEQLASGPSDCAIGPLVARTSAKPLPELNQTVVPPTISVIIPTYQRAHLVGGAIASVLMQSYSNFELLVVDDGSSDGTADVVASFTDERLRLVQVPHGGRSRARNEGAARARGEVIAFLDSDDRAQPDWLQELAPPFEGPAAVACCGARYVDDHQKPLTVMPSRLGGIFANRTGCFLSGTFAVRRAVLETVGGYDARLAYGENSELAIRLVKYCDERALPFAAVYKPLVELRRRRAVCGEAEFRAQLDAAEVILHRHGRNQVGDPSFAGNYRAIAAVNAYRLGLFRRGMRHFIGAATANPGRFVHWSRLALALVPPVARRFWTRPAAVREAGAG